jgi:hypothetical protein
VRGRDPSGDLEAGDARAYAAVTVL